MRGRRSWSIWSDTRAILWRGSRLLKGNYERIMGWGKRVRSFLMRMGGRWIGNVDIWQRLFYIYTSASAMIDFFFFPFCIYISNTLSLNQSYAVPQPSRYTMTAYSLYVLNGGKVSPPTWTYSYMYSLVFNSYPNYFSSNVILHVALIEVHVGKSNSCLPYLVAIQAGQITFEDIPEDGRPTTHCKNTAVLLTANSDIQTVQ